MEKGLTVHKAIIQKLKLRPEMAARKKLKAHARMEKQKAAKLAKKEKAAAKKVPKKAPKKKSKKDLSGEGFLDDLGQAFSFMTPWGLVGQAAGALVGSQS